MLPCHEYQRYAVALLNKKPVLNVACKEDPARLGRDFGAINLDYQDYDPQERKSLYDVPNFMVGDALNLPFPYSQFGTVVIGELLEHCRYDKALRVLQEASRVLKDDGAIVVTVPLDYRPKEVQHAPHLLIEWQDGITSWHQTVWEKCLWEKLVAEARLVEKAELFADLRYGFCEGFGTVLEKALRIAK